MLRIHRVILIIIALIVPAIPAWAEAVVSKGNFFTPITNNLQFVPCALGGVGEFIQLNGSFHSSFTRVLDQNGKFHERIVSNWQGVSGVGLTSGDKYRGTRTDIDIRFQGLAAMPLVLTGTFQVRFIGQGPGNNFFINITMTFVINHNGDVVVQVLNMRPDCK